MQRLFNKLQKNQQKVHGPLQTVFHQISHLNMMGLFKRSRADRDIHHAGLDDKGKQARQIERDIENIDWLIQAGEALRPMLLRAQQRCEEFKAVSVELLEEENRDATASTQAA